MTFKELDLLCKRKSLNNKRVEAYSAQIACLLYNIHRGDNKAKDIEDFMSKPVEPVRKQSEEEMKTIAKMIAAAMGGEINER